MARARQSRAWWTSTVARWRKSGLTGAQFALREDLSVGALRWWSSILGRDTRAQHGGSAIEPIEIAVPTPPRGMTGAMVEVAVGDAIIRCELGADIAYIAALARALAGR
jgi:hypothetical protein